MRGWRLRAAAAVVLALTFAPVAHAGHERQVVPDITKLAYNPIGFFQPGDTLPAANAFEKDIRPLMSADGRFNPSGSYNAFDTNVFEVLGLPYRAAGDEFADDPFGNGGEARHGHCGGDDRSDRERGGDLAEVAGECPNHQLEYLEYYERTMKDILGDFGVALHRYEFDNPGSSNTQSGKAYNPAAVVPGAEHPDETVIVSGHFDQTNDGPASAWDSAEGHAQVIRVAKLMADYWKATGTRPAVTVKFVPWDAEESGTLGSLDYATNNVVPGQEFNVRSYWNTDPCAGGYPAYRFGNPLDRVDLGIQLANIRPSDDPLTLDDTMPPAAAEERFKQFNEKAPQLVEQVFDHLDHTLTLPGDVPRDIFVSTTEGQADPLRYPTGGDIGPGKDVTIGTSRPILFSSDWRNFERLGIPFFNPGPDITGPSSQLEPGNPDAVAILHTPLDNLKTLNAYTAGGTGDTFSEGWIKGMEMCAHLLAWGMLQPEHAGATPVQDGIVAYYEALPNEAVAGKPVTFDASGSHRRSGGTLGTDLEYRWEFGDNRQDKGRVVQHSYDEPGVYQSTLTVRNPASGQSDRMTVPITVVRSVDDIAGPRLDALAAEDADGTFPLSWTYGRTDVSEYSVEEGRDPETVLTDGAESMDGWTAQTPTEPKIQPWQPSDSNTNKVRGNLRRGGERSLWTGISTEDQEPGVGPGAGVSSLTTKGTIALPARKQAVLTYWSDFANDANDFARVEVAIDDGTGAALQWDTVDDFGRASKDEYTLSFQETATESGARFEKRTVDLSAYAGHSIRLRFSYVLGDAQFVNVYRTGWYVDDISVVAAGFREIARTPATQTSYEVTGRKPGTYLYRVRALLTGGARSAASNVEQIKVTG
ncbi:MAG: M28 family peptidase [Chloroflexota bacterium]|nr:M28 family peptidase [Chloroflexota bacterium]